MKRIVPGLFLLLFFSFLFTTCDQEPLFWDIAHEYPPIEPSIKGSPSRIAAVTYSDSTRLYVSNGEIWEWNITESLHPNWQNIGTPGGKIKTVAGTNGYLFSLDRDGTIRKFDGSAWSPSPIDGISGTPEQIFGVGNYLFAGSLTGKVAEKDGYSIFAMNASGSSMTEIKPDTGLLMGAAENGGTYYLGTMRDGIFSTNGSSPGSPVSGTEGVSIIGLVKHEGTIVAVTTGSRILYGGASFSEFASYSGVYFSGAVASWEDKDGNRLLLLGLQRNNSSFGYGYREVNWDDKSIRTPGEREISSVEKGSQYTSAIGNHAVTALYAVPPDSPADKADTEDRPIVFASTQKGGFWSYRIRKETPQWNGEDNSY